MSYSTSIKFSLLLSDSVAPSRVSKRFNIFTATDVASMTMDFSKDSIENGVVDSP